jgi:hypothetical protein
MRQGALLQYLGLFHAPARLSLSEIHVLQHSRSRRAAGTELISKKIHLKKFSNNHSRRAAGTELISNKIHIKKFPKNLRCGNTPALAAAAVKTVSRATLYI